MVTHLRLSFLLYICLLALPAHAAQVFHPSRMHVSPHFSRWYHTDRYGNTIPHKYVGTFTYVKYRRQGQREEINLIRIHESLAAPIQRLIATAEDQHKLIEIDGEHISIRKVEEIPNTFHLVDPKEHGMSFERPATQAFLNQLILDPEKAHIAVRAKHKYLGLKKVWQLFYCPKRNPTDTNPSDSIPLCEFKRALLPQVLQVLSKVNTEGKTVAFFPTALHKNMLTAAKFLQAFQELPDHPPARAKATQTPAPIDPETDAEAKWRQKLAQLEQEPATP